jgi:hypothetical protein
MPPSATPFLGTQSKQICVGLTCWRWERARPRQLLRLAQKLGVPVELTEKIHGLHREIEARVSGPKVDRFIGEFGRHG